MTEAEERKVMPKFRPVSRDEIKALERAAFDGMSQDKKNTIGETLINKKVYAPDYRMMGIGISIGAPIGAIITLVIAWYIWGLPLFLRLFV